MGSFTRIFIPISIYYKLRDKFKGDFALCVWECFYSMVIFLLFIFLDLILGFSSLLPKTISILPLSIMFFHIRYTVIIILYDRKTKTLRNKLDILINEDQENWIEYSKLLTIKHKKITVERAALNNDILREIYYISLNNNELKKRMLRILEFYTLRLGFVEQLNLRSKSTYEFEFYTKSLLLGFDTVSQKLIDIIDRDLLFVKKSLKNLSAQT